jgi:hypothetical protein
MAGSVPAIHLPDTVSPGPQKGVDHRVEPGDDDDLLSFLPNLLQHFSFKQARALRRLSAFDALV